MINFFKSITILFAICLLNLSAIAQVNTPRLSQEARLTQKIGLTDVTISYSRPQVISNGNDRTGQIWGQQIPWGLGNNAFGNQQPMPWRAGANENTIIEFSTDVQVQGKDLSAGKYGLHMIPFEDGKVTVIFSNNSSSWGSYFYDEKEDALRVETKMEDAPFTNTLTYEFSEFGHYFATLSLVWDNQQIPIKISVTEETVLSDIRDQLRGAQGFGWRGYLSAANYCLAYNINHDEAIQWADQAIAANKSGQTLGTKAALLLQKGDTEGGKAAANEAKELSNERELNILGYRLMGANQNDLAEEFFKLNIKRNPKSANCYDSMGECYMAMNKNDQAIKMFKKSLSMNPPAFVKTNSIANLKKLGIEYTE